jgi:hypothetical protein
MPDHDGSVNELVSGEIVFAVSFLGDAACFAKNKARVFTGTLALEFGSVADLGGVTNFRGG